MTALALALLLLTTLVSPTLGEPAAPVTATPTASHLSVLFVPENPADAGTLHQLERLLGARGRVRDFTRFTTERNEPALLVLYVKHAEAGESHCFFDEDDPADYQRLCGCQLVGDTFISGEYSVALVVGGRIINAVSVPVKVLPLTNEHTSNHSFWGQPDYPPGDPRNDARIERTKLINLRDYNEDGHAWEFRIIGNWEAGEDFETMLVGYSAKQRRVILYPIVTGKDAVNTLDHFFPFPDQPAAATVHYHLSCFDHGNDVLNEQDFEYNPQIEAWVMTRQDFSLCFSEYLGKDRSARPTPTPTNVQIHVGSARGFPGETVTIPITIDPNGAEVRDVQIDLPLISEFTVVQCVANHEQYTPPERRLSKFRIGEWGMHALLVSINAGQQPDSWNDEPLPHGSLLCTCEVHVSDSVVPGSYTLSLSGLLVGGIWRLHATATDGEIIVLPPQTPVPDGAH